MVNTDIAALVTAQVPEELVALRDNIARAEAERPGRMWERRRDVYDDVRRLKEQCETTGHPLLIALAGRSGTRRRWMRSGRAERRTCVMCGVEEIGEPANGLLSRLVLGRTSWKFEKLTGRITRTFNDPEAYLQTTSSIKQYSLPTDVVLHRAFPPRIPPSILADRRRP